MDKIWKSNLNKHIKFNIFRVTIEPILLYGSETWTLSVKQQRRLDGCYTRLLKRVQNLSWQGVVPPSRIYPTLSRNDEFNSLDIAPGLLESLCHLLFSESTTSYKRCRKLTYPDSISRESGIDKDHLLKAMLDRDIWKDVVNSISAEVAR